MRPLFPPALGICALLCLGVAAGVSAGDQSLSATIQQINREWAALNPPGSSDTAHTVTIPVNGKPVTLEIRAVENKPPAPPGPAPVVADTPLAKAYQRDAPKDDGAGRKKIIEVLNRLKQATPDTVDVLTRSFRDQVGSVSEALPRTTVEVGAMLKSAFQRGGKTEATKVIDDVINQLSALAP
jgi:hypothetical protein